MTAKITATWDVEKTPETKIVFKNYDGLSRIEKLDFIKDIINELDDLYDKELSKFTVAKNAN